MPCKVYEVHTDSPLPILLLYNHSVIQPLRVEYLLDSPCLLELSHFVLDSVGVLLGGTPRWLFFGSG